MDVDMGFVENLVFRVGTMIVIKSKFNISMISFLITVLCDLSVC